MGDIPAKMTIPDDQSIVEKELMVARKIYEHVEEAILYTDQKSRILYVNPAFEIATGYSNGTFKPNAAITREDAAKMLALTIDVNSTNPKNPGFKDVTVEFLFLSAETTPLIPNSRKGPAY